MKAIRLNMAEFSSTKRVFHRLPFPPVKLNSLSSLTVDSISETLRVLNVTFDQISSLFEDLDEERYYQNKHHRNVINANTMPQLAQRAELRKVAAFPRSIYSHAYIVLTVLAPKMRTEDPTRNTTGCSLRSLV